MTLNQKIQTALVSAILCILAPFSLSLPFTPVPVSLSILVIFIAAYILPPFSCTVSVLIYLLLGMAGLPVFSGFSGGIWKLAGPTGGYLIGFLFAAFLSSRFIHAFPQSRILQVTGMVLGLMGCYFFGTLWFSLQQKMNFSASLLMCVVPFLPADAVKILISAIAGPILAQRIKKGVPHPSSR